MRIVYLANSRWPTIRGAEQLLLIMLENARDRGYSASVIALEGSALHEACRAAGFESYVVEFSPRPAARARLRALLREIRPDIVHGTSIFSAAFVRWWHLVPDSGRVAFFADVSVDPTSSLPITATRFRRSRLWVRNTIARTAAPSLAAIFAHSRSAAEGLKKLGVSGRIIVNEGVIDPERLARRAGAPFSVPGGTPRIGYAGYLEPLKGVDVLITAFASVVKRHPEAVLLLAGDGPQRAALAEFAESLGVGDRVRFLGNLDPVEPMLASLDLFAAASRSEALGRSILEAMALGIPCVSTRSGGPETYIEDGVSGLLVPVDDPAALADAMERLLGDAASSARIAERGKAVATAPEHLQSTALDAIFSEYDLALGRLRSTAPGREPADA